MQKKEGQQHVSSGARAPVSGLYRSGHVDCAEEEFWIAQAQRLPLCSKCGRAADFLLVQQVDHISRDSDFS